MKKFGYIIPIHEKNDLVFRALKSVVDRESTLICISTNEEIAKWIEENKGDLNFDHVGQFLSHDTSYPNLVNGGIGVLKDQVEFISILEFDDTVSAPAHDAIIPYFEELEADVFLPLAAVVVDNKESDQNKDQFTFLTVLNEAPFAAGLADDYGIMDFNMILKANFAFVNGAYFKPGCFDEYGYFKTNFEILADYELITRFIYEGAIVKSIPKIARFHYKRDEGAFEQQKKLSQEEREKWLKHCKREYMFKEDRVLN